MNKYKYKKNKASCHELSLILVREEELKHSQKWLKWLWRPNGGCFHNYTNKLFSVKPIFWFVAATFLFVFVVLISLSALFAFFQPQREKWLCLFWHHSPYFSRSQSDRVVFEQMFFLCSVSHSVRFMVLFWFFLEFTILLNCFIARLPKVRPLQWVFAARDWPHDLSFFPINSWQFFRQKILLLTLSFPKHSFESISFNGICDVTRSG